jgi:putrescine transport system ATP-binding protein
MNGGVVEQIGTPHEIYEYPRTLFVAQFIGSINSFEGEIRETKPDAITLTGVAKRPWTVKPARDGSRPLPIATVGTPARILVRPEKLKVLKSLPGPEQNVMEGMLKEVLYQGPVTQLYVTPKEGNGPTIIVSQSNTALTARKSFAVGDKIFVAWLPEDCILMGKDAALPSGQEVEVSAGPTVEGTLAAKEKDMKEGLPVG